MEQEWTGVVLERYNWTHFPIMHHNVHYCQTDVSGFCAFGRNKQFYNCERARRCFTCVPTLKRLRGCMFPFAELNSRHLKEPVRTTSCQMSSQFPTVHQDQCALMPLHNACTKLALASATNSNISTISLLMEPTCRTPIANQEKGLCAVRKLREIFSFCQSGS